MLRYLGEIILIVAFVHEGNTRKHVCADYFEICFLGKEGEELRFRGGGGRNGRTKLEKGAKNELMSVLSPLQAGCFIFTNYVNYRNRGQRITDVSPACILNNEILITLLALQLSLKTSKAGEKLLSS